MVRLQMVRAQLLHVRMTWVVQLLHLRLAWVAQSLHPVLQWRRRGTWEHVPKWQWALPRPQARCRTM